MPNDNSELKLSDILSWVWRKLKSIPRLTYSWYALLWTLMGLLFGTPWMPVEYRGTFTVFWGFIGAVLLVLAILIDETG
jgi:hypothetical protein